MRWGLVGIGAVLIVLGGATLVSVTLLPPAQVTEEKPIVYYLTVDPNGTGATPWMWGLNGSSASFSMTWWSTGPLDVSLLVPGSCGSSECPPTAAKWGWVSRTSGSWAENGTARYPYDLVYVNDGNDSVVVSVTCITSDVVTTAPNGWSVWIPGISGLVLLFIGGLSVILGVFLRTSIYGVPPEPRPPFPPPGEAPFEPPIDPRAGR
ncbi:MAG: hypothetical protein L3K03_05525 [Thermoplasmata archaeon]|nr:hypothetical protein [Thermoplasmata archaeon]